ncbi:NAD(P)/FAD-dependent oxidoreductase [Sphingomonas rubra]|uniref:Dehydrogenase (Flavoprotein) n=1 Tax=Sphingomonas rubra TaxID=634430 RepID=A0A1I5RCJ9_9SPHN|nr:FAD-dependent monooxygenase [Sphingomonas rubra]SFP56239.1 Dehydrogenase (flavoprotein) [Sphingomonas rubra]
MRRTAALIVGGGPAGSAAAIALAQGGTRAVLLERSRDDEDALCGGFLSWRTLATLGRIGIDADLLNPARITRARLFAGSRRVEAALPFAALAVSRRRLDALLLARATALAGVERGVVVRAVEAGSVRLADDTRVSADALFLATGKHDLRGVARPAGARGADPTLGLRVRLDPHPRLAAMIGDAIELHLFRGGYAGLVVQEDGSANLCLAVHRSRLTETGNPGALLGALGREAPMLGERLAFMTSLARIDAIANVPYGWQARRGDAGLFRLGDQAGVIPSLAGEGMGIALASGLSAAAAHARGGPAAAAGWQPRFARAIRRPIMAAGLARDLAESRLAPLLVGLLPAATIRAVAHATRLPRDAEDGTRPSLVAGAVNA